MDDKKFIGTFDEAFERSEQAAHDALDLGAEYTVQTINPNDRTITTEAAFGTEQIPEGRIHHGRPSHVYKMIDGIAYCIKHKGACQDLGHDH